MTLEDFDDGTDEPNRSEPADMGGGKSSGPQDLLNGPDDSAEQTDEPTNAETDVTYPTEPQPLEDVIADQTTHSVSESADKITLTTNVKRGSGTRDEDKIRVKVKGSDPETTVAKLDNTLSNLERFGVVDQLRETQPGESDE